jgi:hypothetical protein
MFAKARSGRSTKDAIKAAVARLKQIYGRDLRTGLSPVLRWRSSPAIVDIPLPRGIPRQRHINDSSCAHNARTRRDREDCFQPAPGTGQPRRLDATFGPWAITRHRAAGA